MENSKSSYNKGVDLEQVERFLELRNKLRGLVDQHVRDYILTKMDNVWERMSHETRRYIDKSYPEALVDDEPK